MRAWWVWVWVVSWGLSAQAQAPAGSVDPPSPARPAETVPSFEDDFGRAQMALGRIQLGVVFPRGQGESIAPFRAVAPVFVMPLGEDLVIEGDQVALHLEILDFESLDMSETLRISESFMEALHGGARYDAEVWGAQAGLHLLGVGFNELHAFSPVLGLRLGALDRGFVAARLELRGIFAFSTGDLCRGWMENSLLSLAASLPVSGALNLQGRLRLRDYSETCPYLQFCDFKQRDLWLTMGFEAAFDVGVRLMPLYVGFGIRQVFEHVENGEAIEAPGQQFLLVIEPLLGFAGQSQVW